MTSLAKSITVIAGHAYLVASVLGNVQFDLMGNSVQAQTYYCAFRDAAYNNPFRIVPTFAVIIVTAILLFKEARKSFGSQIFIGELSILSAVLVVEIPLFAKSIQLQTTGCSSVFEQKEGPWPIHKNLLMLHMCLLLTLSGSVVARTAILVHKTSRRSIKR